MQGVQREFEAVGDAEFIEDIVQVVLHGLLGDEEFFADFAVAETLRDEADDFFLAVAEQRLISARAALRSIKCGLAATE